MAEIFQSPLAHIIRIGPESAQDLGSKRGTGVSITIHDEFTEPWSKDHHSENKLIINRVEENFREGAERGGRREGPSPSGNISAPRGKENIGKNNRRGS